MSDKLKIYGIRNCDTVKKALRWLNERDVDGEFIDFKKEAPSAELVTLWFKEIGDSKVVNKRGLTWRKLSDEQKASSGSQLVQLLVENPSIIKRPVVCHHGVWSVGFDEDDWESRLLN
ncbi:Spx/MgsR family RNA polymerase-binding regulatory protein [Aliikangiella sp. G2MR2-5]|uniref:Spx/MgsR family RNA polymerase-binding regulatory protein n=1 Tax=Aliikangiella sp. G2MR2-5 TaxID=2788943 RepID=UPI0018A9FB9E|nr:Spx/MgsR family RNA polymerase-binding regulatory protein [Aliikangiella sp. G2MR2-5]